MPTDPLRPHHRVYATITDQGGMLLDTRGRGRWYALSRTAAHLWQALASGATLDTVAADIARHYHRDPSQVRTECQALLTELDHRGLLRRQPRRWWRW